MTTTRAKPKSRIRAARLLIDEGARRYTDRHLERLLSAHFPASDGVGAGSAAVIARIKQALRRQRQLARAGHWSYDLNRHFGLLQALKSELARARREPGRQTSPQPAAAAADSRLAPATDPTTDDTGTDTS